MGSIKELTLSNWRDADPVMEAFVKFDPQRGPQKMDADDWAEIILSVDIDPRAPEELRGLFEAARGSLLYGWFYYPLYALGDDQLHRVAERAVAYRAKQLDAPSTLKTFEKRIDWLADQGVIADVDRPRWHAIRGVRNEGTHPDFQRVAPPAWSLDTLRLVADAIDHVLGFTGPPRRSAP
jgi:hypothetical protein